MSDAASIKRRLGEILVEDGCLSRESLDEALNHQKSHGGVIGQILISLGYISEENLVAALSWQLKIPYLPLSNYAINMETPQIFTEDFCKRHMIIPFDQDSERIYLAVADPLNEVTVQEVEKKTKLKPQVYISTSTEILNMIDLAFSHGAANPG